MVSLLHVFIPTGFVMQLIESAETRIEFVSIGAVLYFASRKMTVFLPVRKANKLSQRIFNIKTYHVLSFLFYGLGLLEEEGASLNTQCS